MAHSVRRIVVTLMLLGVAVAVLAALGAWQLRRAEERRAIAAHIEAGRRLPPLELAPTTSPDQLTAWRPALATGEWLTQYTVLLDNRNQDGKPGYWLAMPLRLGATGQDAVLVLRGWLPRALPGRMTGSGNAAADVSNPSAASASTGASSDRQDSQGAALSAVPVAAAAMPSLPETPAGIVSVTGELSSHVPRLFELWSFGDTSQGQLPTSFPAPNGVVPQVQNLELTDYAQATGLRLLPAVLMQTRGADTLVRDWPQPSVDYHQNQGYALQWFSFAAIAAVAWLVVAWRHLRRRDTKSVDSTNP